ncbi:MAG: response regulator [Candidatus Hydrogenedentes bacterium]|nr:response regulator [Candidatus Hydrogenedentota bacterium]
MSRPREVKILLVEDDEVDVIRVQRGFHQLRIANEIVRARDGIEALEILRGAGSEARLETPFLVLLDINLPRMTGLEFLAALRADEALKVTVVFVLTTSKNDEDRLEAYRHNVAGFMLKDEAGREFVKAMEMLACYWRVVELP